MMHPLIKKFSTGIALLALMIGFLLPGMAFAGQVTLQWDANTPAPDGYRIFQRTADGTYDYTQPVWTGTATTTTIQNLTDNTTYAWVVRAYVGSSESADSNEVVFTVEPAPKTITYPIRPKQLIINFEDTGGS